MPRYETDAAQTATELTLLIDLLRHEAIGSFLEVGCRYGGSLWKIARSMPVGSRIVAVDMPSGFGGRPDGKEVLSACIKELVRLGYDASVVWGNSTDPEVIAQVEALAPFDAVFLDGDHRLDVVTADWNNYGGMAKIVAFHDIAWHRPADWPGKAIAVPQVWESLKSSYRHQEFRTHPSGKDNGIGVLWRTG
jgi:predicted O-methyltransferase YrrM